MRHASLPEGKHWSSEEYAAGFRARLSEIPDTDAAHPCWRCGWQDADTEALELARHKRALAEGREDHFRESWGHLFDSGEEARINGVPFDEGRTKPWKAGWIDIDIELGLLEEQQQ